MEGDYPEASPRKSGYVEILGDPLAVTSTLVIYLFRLPQVNAHVDPQRRSVGVGHHAQDVVLGLAVPFGLHQPDFGSGVKVVQR